MHYNKKSLFFRKIASKIVGKSSHKRKGDKCQTAQRAPSSSHHHQEKSGDGGQPVLIAVTAGNNVAPPSVPIFTNASNSTNDIINSTPKPTKPVISGLLAAKLKCDEWGLNSQTQTTAPKRVSMSISQATSSSCSSPRRRRHPIQRPRLINNKVHHPSYKPPMVQRSASMKERREAMEKNNKYHNQCFSSTLYRIDEVDEKGLD